MIELTFKNVKNYKTRRKPIFILRLKVAHFSNKNAYQYQRLSYSKGNNLTCPRCFSYMTLYFCRVYFKTFKTHHNFKEAKNYVLDISVDGYSVSKRFGHKKS